ncbi:MAG TPA: twin-arginine translocation (TAT) pathway signal sequence domain protein, partial [Terrimicrobiaceae bacterium]|nr:twin-arginine translocation (TAT) pathway signal sequence domain protein [Terrimicrobiaceae bacterium]
GEWEPLAKYREEFQHPLWREFHAEAAKEGHYGGDFFVVREFTSAIRESRPPLIDVYDAVTWSSITPLSRQSIAGGSVPVEVPNFRRSQS